MLDTNLGRGHDAQEVMRLLLVASLANVPGAIKGLTLAEIIANLCAPGRDISRLQSEVMGRLVTAAWYLHTAADGRLHIKNVQNLIARVTTTAGAYLRDQSIKQLKDRLKEIFKPETGWCYQAVLPLPAVDEIDITADKVTLVISEPHPQGLHPDLVQLYEQLTFANRICFLTGQRAFDSLLARARELKAITQIIEELRQEGTPENDPQMQQARDQFLPRFLAQFHSAIRETFTTLFFPTKDRLSKADFLMEFKENRYHGEEQVISALKDKYKYTDEITGDTFIKKVEARLFTQKSMLWSEIKRRAATTTAWQWHKPDALDKLKADCVHKDIWRENGSYVEKGPFPKPATGVKVQELSRNDDTGQARLRVTPVNGDTIYAELGGTATQVSMKLDQREIETGELTVSFLAIDSAGGHQTGEAVPWRNRISLKSRDYGAGDGRMVELKAAPLAPIRYTTDGSDPKVNGGSYEGAFYVSPGTRFVLAYAEKGGIASEVHKREIHWDSGSDQRPEPIDKSAPAIWRPHGGVSFQTTQNAYGFINRLKKHAAQAGGLRLAVLDEQWADLNLSENIRLDSDQIEQTVERLRALVPEGEVTVEATYLRFETGQRLLDYAQEVKVEINREDVEP